MAIGQNTTAPATMVVRLVRCHHCLVIFGTVSGSRLCLHCRAQAEPAQPQVEEAAPPAPLAPPAPVANNPEPVDPVVAPVAVQPPSDSGHVEGGAAADMETSSAYLLTIARLNYSSLT